MGRKRNQGLLQDLWFGRQMVAISQQEIHRWKTKFIGESDKLGGLWQPGGKVSKQFWEESRA